MVELVIKKKERKKRKMMRLISLDSKILIINH